MPEDPRTSPPRLQALDRTEELRPWVRSHRVTRFQLYWIGVNAFPAPAAQRAWLMTFFDRFNPLVSKKFGLRPELFLQYKAIHPHLMDPFLKSAIEFSPMIGLSRRPGKPLPPLPGRDFFQHLVDTGKPFVFNDHVGDYCYWFVEKQERRQREVFLGYGGLTTIYLKPDPATKAPPPVIPAGVRRSPEFQKLFEKMDPVKCMDHAYALTDGFQAKSKELFGDGLRDEPQFEGLPFILPLLSAPDFLGQSQEVTDQWFELFQVYVNESPADKGLLLASQADLEPDLCELLQKMREDGLVYPAAAFQ